MTRAELESAGIHVTPAVHARLDEFVRLLLAENQKLNLTGIRTEPEVWRVHICDSLAALPLLTHIEERGGLRLLDLGTGGGVPGIPLAIAAPQLAVVLLDATRKKVAAVERMIAELELAKARAVWGRAETVAKSADFRGRFDIVVARAVAGLPALLGYAGGLLRAGGEGWFYKSAGQAEAERGAAEVAGRAAGLKYVDTHRYRLPGETDDRVILVYRKAAGRRD